MAAITSDLADRTAKLCRHLPLFFAMIHHPTHTAGSGTNASEYLTETIDRKIVRVGNSQLLKLRIRDCFVQRALSSRVVHAALEQSLFSVSHEDLAPQNIFVGSEYNIKGYESCCSTLTESVRMVLSASNSRRCGCFLVQLIQRSVRGRFSQGGGGVSSRDGRPGKLVRPG